MAVRIATVSLGSLTISKLSPKSFTSSGSASRAASSTSSSAGVRHGAAVARDGDPYVRGRAVAVVGQTLDQQCDAGWSVCLVHQGLVVSPAALGARTSLDGPVDVVVGDRGLFGLLDRVVERGIARGITTADASCDLDVLDQLGEQLASPRIDHGLFVLGGRPLGVSGHGRGV